MDRILNIHTATQTAIVNIVNNGKVEHTRINNSAREHAAFLHTAIDNILREARLTLHDIRAIGVSNGPGSYTGIRIGLATTLGLCYALKLPLISFNTFEVMAAAAIAEYPDYGGSYCPLIEARRMEAYAAVYDINLNELFAPSALILNEYSFYEYLAGAKTYFFGSGTEKFEKICRNKNAVFISSDITSESLALVSWNKFIAHDFDGRPYAKPLYVKEFNT
jgi:tRNA threonylcarbamoyladenosine biosynthesis protein TsaB